MMIVTVRSLSPTTQYDGVVYEQNATIETASGKQFGVFDPDLKLSNEDVDEEVSITLTLLTPKRDAVSVPSKGVGVYPNLKDPQGTADHSFCGKVVDEQPREGGRVEIRLDVGDGEVRALIPESELSTSDGLLCVEALRVQLVDVKRECVGTDRDYRNC